MHQRIGVRGIVVALLMSMSLFQAAAAETLQSTNYKFDEATVGAGNMNQASSTNFQASSSFGDLGVGNSASGNFQIEAGSQTTPDPTLSLAILTTNANFGLFSASTPTIATSSFAVLNYTSYGYAVQLTGTPPSNGAHTITGMGTTATSQPGIEQFGINLVANSQPSSFGANPDNGQFGFGQVGTGSGDTSYSTPNEFRYVSGETIASAPKSSGKTIYTISYLVNAAGITPGGQYISNQTLIVTGTY